MNEAAEEVCDLESERVANPWMIGHEREVNEMREEIERLINERNSKQERIIARRRLRVRRGGGELARLERELIAVKEQLGRVRRNMSQFLRRVEREWWRERIEECDTACNSGRMGEMYKILKEIGRKEWKAPPSDGITVEEFREHFEKVSVKRNEVDPAVIGGVIEKVRDLRGCEKAREAYEFMNGELEIEKIEEAMKEMKESAPGKDGIRMCYLKEACEEMKDALIGMVQFMFEERAHKWDEWLKGGVMCPLFKKGDRREKGNYRGVVLLAMGSRMLARVCAKMMR